MTVTEVLEQARALIADEAHWCQDALALDAAGIETDPTTDDAVQWCAIGATCRVTHDLEALDGADRLLWRAIPKVWPGWPLEATVSDVNDDLGHEAVMALFDRALVEARLEAEVAP